MKRKLTASVWREDDLYVAQCMEIDVASQGPTEEEALANLQEAIELHLTPPVATVAPKTHMIEVEVA